MSARPTPADVFGRRRGTTAGAQPQPVHPTPADVTCGPGVVCRIYVGTSLVYSTKRLTLDEANAVADRVEQSIADGDALFPFPSAHHERARVVPEHIRSVEVVRVDAFAVRAERAS